MKVTYHLTGVERYYKLNSSCRLYRKLYDLLFLKGSKILFLILLRMLTVVSKNQVKATGFGCIQLKLGSVEVGLIIERTSFVQSILSIVSMLSVNQQRV